jgi:hypothetical protein
MTRSQFRHVRLSDDVKLKRITTWWTLLMQNKTLTVHSAKLQKGRCDQNACLARSQKCFIIYDMIYLLTAIGLPPGGSSTVHIYTQTIHRTTQNKQYIEQHNNLRECGPCPVLARFTMAFALQLRKKHEKTSIRVAASKNK